MIKVQIENHWSDRTYTEPLADFLQPQGRGIEGELYVLRAVVGKLLAVAVENKLMTFQEACRVADVPIDGAIKLVEE